jgi:hypothetical protein
MFLSFLLSCVAIVKASDVVDLDPSNFDKIVDGSRYALVEFYAPCNTFSDLKGVDIVRI